MWRCHAESEIILVNNDNIRRIPDHKKHAAPWESSPGAMNVSAKAASCSITTVLNLGGLTGGFDAAEVTNAVFESEVKLVTASTFTERGIISFGDARHRLNFVSAGEG